MNDVEPAAPGEAVLSRRDGPPQYMSGFGNSFSTEAVAGALPIGRNSPQKAPLGLYAEQLSGTAFTAPRHLNKRTWLYRIRPSVRNARGFQAVDISGWRTAPCRDEGNMPISQLRWRPVELPDKPTDFLAGLKTMATCGDAHMQEGIAIHVYVANRSMGSRYLYNGDGEMLIVPQQGRLSVFTECGRLVAGPGEILILPRGMKFKVDLLDDAARGYVCENYGAYFTLPERGPIGANCLANARDFLSPVAGYEDGAQSCELFVKAQGKLYSCQLPHSPLDVVAWHGNHVPVKYDLRRFSPVGSILFDHPDPSIYTVLTSQSAIPGTANIDFVIFPERWLVMEDSFRPPWYHMNAMSEFMGLIYGIYDAKPGGFTPGAMSIHNSFIAHGPDADAFEQASKADLSPHRLKDTLAFMFETRFPLALTAYAESLDLLESNYPDCWDALERHFPTRQP